MEAPLSHVDSYQYPAAHFGHLSESQQTALESFKKLCQEKGYYQAAGTDGRKHNSHDDETMLRYLRARKFNPEEAFGQFKDTEDWRKENRLEEYYDQIDIREYDEARRLYPQWTGRRDKRGIPVYVFEVSHLNSKAISSYQSSLSSNVTPSLNKNSNVPPKMLRLFALYENLTRFVLPLCSAIQDRLHPETPISQSNNIVDISRVGLKQFWNLKTHMQDASTLATAHYPETLDRIFIIGAPAFFPTVWSWIKRWFDPITVSKIFILSAQDMKPTLEKYILPENIPRKYGGTLDYEFGMMPVLEPAIVNALEWQDADQSMIGAATGAMKDAVEETVSKVTGTTTSNKEKTFPTGPIKWRELPTGELQAIAVGSDSGTRREKVIARVHTDFGGIHGISRTNTVIDWSKESVVSTTGTATQPTDADDVGPDFSGELKSQDAMRSNTVAETAAAAEGTHGTATTREPLTVGQAQKDVTADVGDQAPVPAPGYVEQAKGAVSSVANGMSEAVGGVLGSVGIGSGAKTDEGVKGGEKVEVGKNAPVTPGTADLTDRSVEEFLRDQHSASSATA